MVHVEPRPSFLGDALKHRTINAGRFALTGVALAASCLLSTPAWALGLGRLNVQSVLGETLRAEIDVSSISAEESGSLRLRVAPPEAYRAAGVEYNAVLTGAQVVLERRADGRPYLRVSSSGAVLEPFIDVIVEATWTSGRLVREYTMLFDPPSARVAAAPAAVTAPLATAAPAALPSASPSASPVFTPTAPSPAPAVAAVPRTTAPPPRVAQAPTAPAVAGAPAAAIADEYRVRRGDSLSGVAARTQRQGVSLDQMLVSLFRGNPEAFVGDNMNRLKAGAVLNVPAADAAKKITAAEAREVIQAQSADFSAYRQRLASGAVVAAEQPASRVASGTVQTKVDDRKQAANTAPDKLKLSQGAIKASAPEAKLSKESERKDAAARLAELSRNVDDLKRLQQGTAAASAPAKTTAGAAPPAPAVAIAPAPAIAAPPAVVAVATVPPLPSVPTAQSVPPLTSTPPVVATAAPSGPASAALGSVVAAAAPLPTASAPAAPASAPVMAKAPTPKVAEDEPSFLSALSDSPLLLPGAGVLVVLLGGLGIYRLRSGMRKREGETSFLESRLQPDSFFGQSGGQRVDTKDAGATGASSSMSYSLSQLDAIGDVDPVAEADVYLAYGRDLQAEEILKEAMRSSPDRLAIRTKLLEVYAKRRDTKGFELLATQLHSTTRGEGEDWAKVQAMGLEIDPENLLYAPGGSPDAVFGDDGDAVEVLNAPTVPHTAKPTPAAFVPAADVATLDGGLDLDLNLELDGDSTLPNSVMPLTETTQALQTAAAFNADDSGSFDSTVSLRGKPDAGSSAGSLSLDFDLGDLGEPTSTQAPYATHGTRAAAAPAAPAQDSTLGDEFGEFTMPSAVAFEQLDAGDPLSRKLELAEEFRQIGDTEGARDLLEEVLAKADGALKAKAQGMLNGLG